MLKKDHRLDKEASDRGTSVYLVDRVIPMIPHRLIEWDLLTESASGQIHFVVKWRLNAEGEVVNHEIFQSVIKTTERMTYHDVNKILVDKEEEVRENMSHLYRCLKKWKNLQGILQKKRMDRGQLTLILKKQKCLSMIRGNRLMLS